MNLQVGVKLIIKNSKDEVLLIKRSGYEHLDEVWDIPGGRIDPEEHLLDALHREVREEIGADFSTSPSLVAAQDIFASQRSLHVVRLTYRIQEDLKVNSLSKEHSEAKYLSRKEIAALDVDPYLLELVQKSLI